MKVLFIGNANARVNKGMIEKILTKDKFDVSVLSFNGNVDFKEFYKKEGIDIYVPQIADRLNLRFINVFIKYIKIILYYRKNKFDLIQINYISPAILFLEWVLRGKNTKCVASFFGSDLYRTTSLDVLCNKLLLRNIDAITVSTEEMLNRFYKDYGASFKNKIFMTKFGLIKFDMLLQLKKSEVQEIHKIKEKLGLPGDKKIISIGYNRTKEQQHLKVLEQIRMLSEELQKQLHLVLLLSYGSFSEEYIKEILNKLKELKCTYTCFTDFLEDETIVKLELATDVFIHAQTTDAFSATMQEHIFAEKLVINGKWLQYKELKKAGIYYWEFEKWAELKELLEKFLKLGVNNRELKENANKIYKISSWQAVFPLWQSIYKRIWE